MAFPRGRRMPRLTPRRAMMLIACFALLIFASLSTLASSMPSSASSRALTAVYDSRFSAPRLGESFSKSALNPFKQPAHERPGPAPPPRTKSDTFGGSSWWADWKWIKTPFSSAVTHDDDRTLLPPSVDRPSIYCYYDDSGDHGAAERDAESALLLTWRRAWWAQGFRPVILSAAEAVLNPQYRLLQALDVDQEVRDEVMRWLAWDTMGGGMLAQYTLLPVAPRDDPTLSFLRRGDFPELKRWTDLRRGLFVGPKKEVSAAVAAIMGEKTMLASSIEVLVGMLGDRIATDGDASSFASYGPRVLEAKYAPVAKSLAADRARGLGSLNDLINAHLQNAWQNRFPRGIEVVKPAQQHTTAMVGGAVALARQLAACAHSPLPATCAPNLAQCTPCVARTPVRLTTPKWLSRSRDVYSIVTVPHPWTYALVTTMRDTLDVAWIRRESPRNPWLAAVTQGILGTGVSASPRVVRAKELVVDGFVSGRALWLTAEGDVDAGDDGVGHVPDADWYLGFAIPTRILSDGKSLSPVPADRLPKPQDTKVDRLNGPVAGEDAIAAETALLRRARLVITDWEGTTPEARLRTSLESWSLADTEAWRFVKAFQARRTMERRAWEDAEAKFSRGAGTEKGRSSWSRWRDAVR